MLPFFVYVFFLLYLVVLGISGLVSLVLGDASGWLLFLHSASTVFFLCALVLLGWPLLLIKGGVAQGLAVDRDQQGGVFDVFDLLAKALDLPKIKNILLVSDNYVDARYDSIKDFHHRQVTLCLGLSFFRVFDVSTLLSLVMRELSRCHHQSLRRPYFVIRFCLAWCYRVIHFDVQKYVDAGHVAWPIQVIEVLEFGAQLAQKLFEALSYFLAVVSQSVFKKNELRLDEYQRCLINHADFSSCLSTLARLDQAWYAALEQISDQATLQRNHFDLIARVFKTLQHNENQHIELAPGDQFSSWHFLPPIIERVNHSAKVKTKSLLRIASPAQGLLTNANQLEAALSEVFYRECKPDSRVEQERAPDSSARLQTADTQESLQVLNKFSSGLFRSDIVWEVPDLARFASLSDTKLIAFLNKVVVSIRHNLPEFNRFMVNLDEYQKQQKRYHFYSWLYKDGSRNRPAAEAVDKVKFDVKEYEPKFTKNFSSYRQSYGMRVAVAVVLGRNKQSFNSAAKLVKILNALAAMQLQIIESNIKSSTLAQMLARRAEGDEVHQKTISRLTKMLLKMVDDLEKLLASLPVSLISAHPEFDVQKNRLDKESLNGGEYEGRVLERYSELLRYFETCNVMVSAKLAQFVSMIERTQKIESVVKVELPASAP